MIRNGIIVLLIGAGFWACSDVYTITAQGDSVDIDSSIQVNSSVDSLISPYKDEMSATMSVNIAFAGQDFVRGRPNAALNNWSADAILSYSLKHRRELYDTTIPVMCLLNFGGLRNPISEGPVSVGDIYKLMPFDNEIVWVKMPWESIIDIADYLEASGGEPIAGATLDKDTLLFHGASQATKFYWVVTSDYLMNGGDKMNFFRKKLSFHYANTLMRDAMLEEAKIQDTLKLNEEIRIKL